MDNLHFIPNNILTNFFKELTKYKNDYQYYLNYIYIGIILCILLYIFKCIHAYARGYKLVLNRVMVGCYISIYWSLILRHVSHLIFKFVYQVNY